MHNLQKTLEHVQDSPTFKAWLADHPAAYLSSFFKIIEGQDVDWWQLDFYYPKGDSITSFVVDDKVKLATKDSAVFKKPEDSVQALDLKTVAIDIKKALHVAQELQKEKYKTEKPSKTIVLLQTITRTLWNISFLTNSFKLVNVRIDAKTGDVLEDSIVPLFDFGHQKAS
ncbi:hypothetical protein J4208_04095 [Candidatus Woesearchaeota archaeon]|nr:hypothetical protein [Candidatus Woesearchaeota archaeon]